MMILCQPNELKLSCFGCCGNSYTNKKKIIRDIRKNTLEFENKKSLKSFMTRTTELRSSGICANLILKDEKFFCPGHPQLNKNIDYRNLDPDCHKEHICKTYSLFQTWNKEKQKQFLNFLKSKKLNSYAYSIRLDNNYLLEEFERGAKNQKD
ncbi:hypothetical protein CMO93_01680 [Candidatus Woesearchaeota archaeon]|nr:hypothetical protein [Candidatus Woesearchaeota archaeon]|tara:strand:- start:1026 stop:1481 length:456 start_codon:yes stop_codon:yes gene_type:complete